jgi:hypothetical protein
MQFRLKTSENSAWQIHSSISLSLSMDPTKVKEVAIKGLKRYRSHCTHCGVYEMDLLQQIHNSLEDDTSNQFEDIWMSRSGFPTMFLGFLGLLYNAIGSSKFLTMSPTSPSTSSIVGQVFWRLDEDKSLLFNTDENDRSELGQYAECIAYCLGVRVADANANAWQTVDYGNGKLHEGETEYLQIFA